MVTLKDIGQHLGLSATQVSRALGGYPDVSDATRLRVREAAEMLGYHPNPTALKLRSGRSGIVGLVVPEHSEQEESNILLEILLGLATEFAKRDTLVVLNVMPAPAGSAGSYTRLFRHGAVDGFVVVNPSADPAGIAFLSEQKIPFVSHGRTSDAADYPFVDLDNRAVGEISTARLVALGHRRIAMIDGPEESFSARQRLAGMADALAMVNAAPAADLLCRGMMTERFGETATRRLFADRERAPTAIMAGNMVLATGVMHALRDLGLAVPGDVSVMAHDDVLARYPRKALAPDLSGTSSPFADAWAGIADLLIGAIDGEPPASLQRLITPARVEGGSVAPPQDDACVPSA